MKLKKTISVALSVALLLVGINFSQKAGAQQNSLKAFTPKAKGYTRSVTHGFFQRPDLGVPKGDWFLQPGEKGFRFFERYETTIPEDEINDHFSVETLKASLLYDALPKGIDEGTLFDDGSIITMSGRQGFEDVTRFYTNDCPPPSLWDDEFWIGGGFDIAGNTLTRFGVDPITKQIIKLVTFHFNGQLVFVEVHRSDVHVHYRNRFANNGLYQNPDQSGAPLLVYKFGPTDNMSGLWTISLTSSELMACSQFGWEFKSGRWPGKIYLVPSTVVEMRKKVEGDELPINQGPRGLLRRLQGGFPSGTMCDASNCEKPVTCPTPTPSPTPTPTPTPAPPSPGMKCVPLKYYTPLELLQQGRRDKWTGQVMLVGGQIKNINEISSMVEQWFRNVQFSPEARFNREFVALQLAVNFDGGWNDPRVVDARWSMLGCAGWTFMPITLSNGFVIEPSTKLEMLRLEIEDVARSRRTQDYEAVTNFLAVLNQR